MSTKPTTANFIAANTEAQQKVYFQSWLEACGQLPGGSPAVDMTILTGNITPAAGTNTYKVDTESAAATDDLSSINITNLPDGSEIKLTTKLNTRAVTLKHNVGTSGKVMTLLAKDILLREGVFVSLKLSGTTWYEFGGGVVEKATSAEALAGTNDAKYVTPLGLAGAVAAAVPAGVIIAFASYASPAGYLLCNGATFSSSTYPSLYYALGTATLPDLRGVALRGLDDGRGLDSERSINTYQADEFKSHTHTYVYKTQGSTSTAGIAPSTSSAVVNATTAATGGTETRMKNVAVRFYIKY